VIDRIRTLLRRRGPDDDAHDADDAADARIRREGFPGRGTVVSVEPTGRTRHGRSEVRLTLDVFIPRLRQFRVELRPWVNETDLTRLESGRAVPVAADQSEPGHVVLALDMDEPRSIAGLGPFAGGRGGPRPLEGVDPDRPGPDAGR
jgi:hypothetical protein